MNSKNLDANDLQDRIDTLYYATDSFIKRQPVAKISVKQDEVEEGRFILSFGGGEISGEEVRVAKHTFTDMVSRLANIKDPLKKKLKNINLSETLAEDCINNSQHLQIIMDLNNAEKHGYPLQKTRRSKRDPRIENIRKEMLVPLNSGRFTNVFSESIVVFCADIVDLSGNRIQDFHNLIEQAVVDWEDFCIQHFPTESRETIRRRNIETQHYEWQIDHFARGQQVQELINDKDAWIALAGSEVVLNMFVRATGPSENSAQIMGYPSRPIEEWKSKNYIPLTNVETGEQNRLSKKNYSWEVFTAEKLENIRLVSDYYWELLNPPSFK